MTYADTKRVLYHSRAQGTAKLLLASIADHVGVAGAWPSIDRLAFMANVADERHVRRLVRSLEALGELVILNRPGRSSQYVITCPCPPECPADGSHVLIHTPGPQTLSTPGPQTPGPQTPGPQTPGTPGPQTPTPRVHTPGEETKNQLSETPVVQQSVTTGHAREVVDLDAVRARIRTAKAGTS